MWVPKGGSRTGQNRCYSVLGGDVSHSTGQGTEKRGTVREQGACSPKLILEGVGYKGASG